MRNAAPRPESGSVSIRKIADEEEGVSTPISLSELAKVRGIDRKFTGRELITSQKYDSENVRNTLREQIDATWKNWLKDHETTGDKFRVKKKDDVREILLWSAKNDMKVRAVGANHSHSDAAKPYQNFIELSWYDDDDEELRGLKGSMDARPRRSDLTEASNYGPVEDPATTEEDLDAVRVGAGAMLKRLNRKVLKNKGLGLMNMGSYDEQTMAGAVNTSTHGTGISMGSIAESVLSVEMGVVMESPIKDNEPLVRFFRIEPSDGITDAAAFMKNVGKHGMSLIQDDDVFYSAVVGYGAMGVATSYTIKARTKYFLYEQTERKKWNEIKNGFIQEKLNDDNVRHFSFLLNIPSTFGSPSTDNPRCMVRWREYRDWEEKPDKSPPSWPPERTAKAAGDIFRWLRKQTTGFGVDPTTPNPFLASLINRFFKQQTNKPFKDAGLTKRHDTASYIALRRTRDKFSDNPDRPPNPPDPAMTTEVAVSVNDLNSAVEELIAEVENVHNNKDLHFMAPLGVRFAASSEHKLSAEWHGSEPTKWSDGVALLELPFAVGPVNSVPNDWAEYIAWVFHTGILKGVTLTAARLFNLLPKRSFRQKEMVGFSKDALRPIERRLVDEFDGQPHMGKFNKMDCEDISQTYEEFETWHEIYLYFNAFGTFNNRFTGGLGLNVENPVDGRARTSCGEARL